MSRSIGKYLDVRERLSFFGDSFSVMSKGVKMPPSDHPTRHAGDCSDELFVSVMLPQHA